MNFPYNKIFVAQKLSEWQNFKDCTLFAAVCGAKDKLESVPRMWEYVPNCVEGPGKCGIILSDKLQNAVSDLVVRLNACAK